MKKLVAYITSSYPNNSFTVDLALSLKESGVDTLELGIPFSDPVADGEVIQKVNHLALNSDFKLKDLFEVSKEIGEKIDTLWMGYFNPFYKYGLEEFLKKAKEYKISGMIIPDLPFEEAKEYFELFQKYDKVLIDFVAPTDSKERIEKIVKESKKFIYLVAYAGITGSKKEEDLTKIISYIKDFTNTPVYIGFGVNKETAKKKAKDVDGVIVGSAFVKYLLDESLSNKKKIEKISSLAKEIKERINE